MKFVKKVVVLMMVLGLLCPLAACQEKGPAEKAGEKVDSAVDSAKDKAHEIEKSIGHKVEDAGKSME